MWKVYGRSPRVSEAGRGGNRAFTIGQRPGNRAAESCCVTSGRHHAQEIGASSGHQGGVHLDRRHGADGRVFVRRPRSSTSTEEPAHLGLRRFEHQPGAGQGVRLRAEAGVLVPGPDPRRRQHPRHVRGAAHRHDAAPHQHARAARRRSPRSTPTQEPLFGIEQEYTFFKEGRPLGFPVRGFPAPQGFYYCGVGADEVFGRDVVEAHLDACLAAGLSISGINAEVMPGQWEFQVGPLSPLDVSDQLWVARWLLYRIAEDFGIAATLDPKPVSGDWNGAGAHTNFSTKAMRESYDPIIAACEALGKNAAEHVAEYGSDIEVRLTGSHETAPWNEFSYGVSNRGASVRIPWQVEVDKKGYIEDRRPNANMDPYVVTRLITDTCCSALAYASPRIPALRTLVPRQPGRREASALSSPRLLRPELPASRDPL